jgi:hypothetical protein
MSASRQHHRRVNAWLGAHPGAHLRRTQAPLQGIYLLLERLKFPVYRRLFRRVQLLHAEANPAKAAQLPLGGRSSLLLPRVSLSSTLIEPLKAQGSRATVPSQPERYSVLSTGYVLWRLCGHT